MPATASFHLAQLSRAGLIQGTRESRFIHYAANFPEMDALIDFLTRDCCKGQPCLASTRRPPAARSRKPSRRTRAARGGS